MKERVILFYEYNLYINRKIKKKRVDLKIISISTSDLSLQKAELSSKHSSFKFKFLKIKNKIKIQKSEEIFDLNIHHL